MSNVCLIYPRDINLNFFPLGVGYVASYLREKNHTVTLLDLSESDIHLLEKLKGRKIDVVGLSITTPQLGLTDKIIALLKKIIPKTPIVAGGIHPSYYKDKFLEEHSVDYVIYGEGEITMNELCNALESNDTNFSGINGLIFRDNETVRINPPRELIPDMNILPFPARDLVNYETYLQPPGLIRGIWTNRCGNITTSRGCPGRCTFCGVNYLWECKFRRRTVDNVIQEIDLLVDKYNIDGLYFMDDTFLMNKRWIEEFTEKYLNKNYKLKMTCYGRVDTVNEDILKAIKKTGMLQVEYGIESCSERVLGRIKKKTDIRQIKKAIKMTKDVGIRALGSFIFGFPEDNEEDLQASIDIASELNLDFTTCYFATPYPASELYEQAISEDRIIENDMSRWYVRNNNIWIVNLDKDTLNNYRQKFLKKCRYRNILYFIKNPFYFLKLSLFMLENYNALFKSMRDSFSARCFDDFGYYFYTHIFNNSKNRNII